MPRTHWFGRSIAPRDPEATIVAYDITNDWSISDRATPDRVMRVSYSDGTEMRMDYVTDAELQRFSEELNMHHTWIGSDTAYAPNSGHFQIQDIVPGSININIPSLLTEEKPMPDIDALRHQARQLLADLADAQALEDRFPHEPPEFSVIKWIIKHGKREYIYVGLRVDESWFVTGSQGGRTLSWAALKREIGTAPCSLATGWDEIPAPEVSPADAETDPAKWFALVYPQAAIEAGKPAAADDDPVDAVVVDQ